MVSFENDYNKGAHPKVLQRLIDTNLENLSGYGNDCYCESAAEKIRAACGCEQAQVSFISGGTQTNAVVINAMLKGYEGVIAAKTGHISVHEAGAIEYTGHKVLELDGKDGKIDAKSLSRYMEVFYGDESHEHMVRPGMVYISFPTELGTLYSKAELEGIYSVCKQYEMPLFIDGARLGYGLASDACDVAMNDIANLCDVFYIGGTKVGALVGEAVVFTKNNRPEHFVTSIKRQGALLAKGRVLGVQFDALFTDNLYLEISRHAMIKAYELKKIFSDAGYEFYWDSPTNQQFIIIENEKMEKLSKTVKFSFWEKIDDTHTAIRFVTGWGTTDEELSVLKDSLSKL